MLECSLLLVLLLGPVASGAASLYQFPLSRGRQLHDALLPVPPRVPLEGDFAELAYHYLTVHVGSPPQALSVILDTGSSLLAFPCDTCTQCGTGHRRFQPRNSSTAAAVKCTEGRPDASAPPYCTSCGAFGECGYARAFSEGSAFGGRFLTDTVRLGASASASARMQFGCHSRESGLFVTQQADGILGLSGGALALPTALGAGTGAPMPFALCQSPAGGLLTVGGEGDPRLRRHPWETPPATPIRMTPHGLYTVELTGAQLGGASGGLCASSSSSQHCSPWPWWEDSQWFTREVQAEKGAAAAAAAGGGLRGSAQAQAQSQQPLLAPLPPLLLTAASPSPSTAYIDTGSSYTYLPRGLLGAVVRGIERECWEGGQGGALAAAEAAAGGSYAAPLQPSVLSALQRCNGTRVPPTALPPGQVFCVRLTPSQAEPAAAAAAAALATFPTLTLRLLGGALWPLPPRNLLLSTPWTGDMHCLQLFPSDESGGRSVIGSNAMLGYDVGFHFSSAAAAGGGEEEEEEGEEEALVTASLSWALAREGCEPDDSLQAPRELAPSAQVVRGGGGSRGVLPAGLALPGTFAASAWLRASSSVLAPLLLLPLGLIVLAYLVSRGKRGCAVALRRLAWKRKVAGEVPVGEGAPAPAAAAAAAAASPSPARRRAQ